jgi:hypothetical protein
MARFLMTMHMPTGSSQHLVHQVIGDHAAADLNEFAEELNNLAFVVVRQFYYFHNRETNERGWRDRGDLILNTEYIGKVTVHFEAA